MDIKGLIEAVTKETEATLVGVSEESVGRFVQGLDRAERIFCAAHGRSGYVLRCFCMRLMHLGYGAFFVGETITPGITKEDVLVVCSGSGETIWTYQWVRLASGNGASTYGVVGVENSPIGRAVDYRLFLPGGSKRDYPKNFKSIQPPGSLFEQAAFVLLETIVLGLYQRQGSDPRPLLDQHANLE
ncbi:MAG: 6-phospho-3-hexuloisomerase [Thermodesulfobacteriota bacterium]|nr:6-phospho-3-hexuloisomerase [Thermodesulfobacteriota bacterium]